MNEFNNLFRQCEVLADYPATARFNQADSAPINLNVSGSACNLDVNRNTVFDKHDGLMLLRISLGLTGTAVTSNAINPSGTRPDWTSVKNYVNTTCGLSLQ